MPMGSKIALYILALHLATCGLGLGDIPPKKDSVKEKLSKEILEQATQDRDAASARKTVVDSLLAEFDQMANRNRPPFYQLTGDAFLEQESMLADFEAQITEIRAKLALDLNAYLDEYTFEARFISADGAESFSEQVKETLRYKFLHPLESKLQSMRQEYVAQVTPLVTEGGGWNNHLGWGGHIDWDRLIWTGLIWLGVIGTVLFIWRRYWGGKLWNKRYRVAGGKAFHFPGDIWSLIMMVGLLLFCIIASLKNWGWGGWLGSLLLCGAMVIYNEWWIKRR